MKPRLALSLLLWLALPLLVVWAARHAPLKAIVALLSAVDPWALVGLLAFNGFVLLLLPSRWALILNALEVNAPYWAVLRYRLAAFALSYFTPGPQFGGEPLQVYALRQRHRAPWEKAIASVALDKLFELLANFTFLCLAILLALSRWVVLPGGGTALTALGVALLALPMVHLVLLGAGQLPLSRLLGRVASLLPPLWQKHPWIARSLSLVVEAERQVSTLMRTHPRLVGKIIATSFLVWVLLLVEYALSLRLFGVRLPLWQSILALGAARLALLTPLPGGLGALEASQVIAMQALGLDPALGFALSLWMRGRDLAVGVLGAALGLTLTQGRPGLPLPLPPAYMDSSHP